jgi:hypothetical protein
MLLVFVSFCIGLCLLFTAIGAACMVAKWAWEKLVDLIQVIFQR